MAGSSSVARDGPFSLSDEPSGFLFTPSGGHSAPPTRRRPQALDRGKSASRPGGAGGRGRARAGTEGLGAVALRAKRLPPASSVPGSGPPIDRSTLILPQAP